MSTETTGLIQIQNEKITTAITNPEALKVFLDEIRTRVDEFESDITTSVGRKEMKSFLHRITKTKTAVVAVGKEYLADVKAKVKAVEATVKETATAIDNMKSAKRLPLDIWEREQRESDIIIKKLEAITSTTNILAMTTSAQVDASIKWLFDFKPESVIADKRTKAVKVANDAFTALQTLFTTLKTAEDNALELEEFRHAEAVRKAKEAEVARLAELEKEDKEEPTLTVPECIPPQPKIDTAIEVPPPVANEVKATETPDVVPPLGEQLRTEAIEALVNKGLIRTQSIKVIDYIIAGEIPHVRMM